MIVEIRPKAMAPTVSARPIGNTNARGVLAIQPANASRLWFCHDLFRGEGSAYDIGAKTTGGQKT